MSTPTAGARPGSAQASPLALTVAAVIPAWNAADRIGACLEAVADQVEHVIVVDNGSRDATAQLAARCLDATHGRIVVWPENLGFGAAFNAGAREAISAGYDTVLVLNDDVVLETDCVAALAEALARDRRSAAACPRQVYAHRPTVLNGAGGAWYRHRGLAWLRGEGSPDVGQYAECGFVDYPPGAAALMRVAALDHVGPWNADYFLYYEDTDWGLRAQELGWRIRYVPQAVARHAGSAGTAADPARRRYYNVRNRLHCARRHAPRAGHARAWAETLALAAKQPVRWLWSNRRREAEAVLLGLADHLRGRHGRSPRFG